MLTLIQCVIISYFERPRKRDERSKNEAKNTMYMSIF